jgi:prolipoprotein diacylglyceryltransferase
MFVLLWVARKFKEKLKPGDIFFLYLIIYSFGRFMLEFIRIVNSPIAGINSNQALMGFIFIASMIVMFVRHKRPSKEEVVSK